MPGMIRAFKEKAEKLGLQDRMKAVKVILFYSSGFAFLVATCGC